MRIQSSSHTRFRWASSVLVAATVVAIAWVGAGDINPPLGAIQPTNRVQLSNQTITLPHTISQPGSYVITSNLAGVSGQHGIIIAADDVTLDLNGFALLGIGGSFDGVHVDGGRRNLLVVNGTIRGWGGSGVGAGSAINGRFEKLALSNNGDDGLNVGSRSLLIGIAAQNNNAAGVHAGGDGNRIEQCHAAGNTTGYDVDGIQNLLVKNSAVNNGTDYNIAGGNAYGPIASVGGVGDISSVPKANHPWANFSLVCLTWCQDADADGFGDPTVTQQSCTQPVGFVQDCTDCDDADPEVNPGFPEFCDGKDNDCDGQADEEDAVGQETFCRDLDGDGFGDPGDQVQACSAPGGYVSDCLDCNDFDPSVNPVATEECNGIDDNCDGQIDEGGVLQEWYADCDGDGHHRGSPVTACTESEANAQTPCADLASPDGGWLNSPPLVADCDDENATVFPGGTEVCDGLDNDCDGTIDDGTCFANGSTCSSSAPCASGFCVDGFCCNTSCGDPCDACNLSGAEGSCGVSPDGDPGTPSCSPYLCNGVSTSCPSTCGSDADCASGFYCSGGSCVSQKSNGSMCGAANECLSGFCVDGACCDSACDGDCEACTFNKTGSPTGACSFITAGTDPDDECPLGECDGAGSCTP